MSESQNYVRPGAIAPQLSRADLAALTPQEVVRADAAGQLDIIKSGRDPLPFESRGERRGSAEEDAQARAEAAAHARVERTQIAEAVRRGLKKENRP